MSIIHRAIVVVLDSVGIGELPDAADYEGLARIKANTSMCCLE